MSLFDTLVTFILDEEKGYVNNPYDPGGETNWGISKRSYPHLDIKNLTRAQAIEIYRKDFWNPVWEKLGFPLAACMFDTGVNMGVSRAAQFLRACENDYKKFLQLRKERYLELVRNNPSLKIFQNGWLGRVDRLRKFIDATNTGNFVYAGNRKDIT